MARKTYTINYQEGDWIAVPLTSSHHALGLITRVTRRRGIIAGCFFAPAFDCMPTPADTEALTPIKAILIRRFSDLALLNKEWSVVYKSREWDREKWPLPKFVHFDLVDANRIYAREYSDDNLLLFVRETPINKSEALQLFEDGLSGSKALEIQLRKMLLENT